MAGNKVNVIGWYNKRNCGDESYKAAFPLVFPNYSFTFSEQPIKDADAYILGGGDVVSEQMLEKFKNIKKPKHIMSVTISKTLNPKLLENFRTIIVRDKASRQKLKEIGIESLMYPDFAFLLSPNKDNGTKLINEFYNREGHELYNKKIMVVINSHLIPFHGAPAFEHARLEKFFYDLAISLDNTSASFIFIPFGTKAPWDDRLPNAIVASRCKYWKKNLVVYKELTVQETLDITSACDTVISSRLHSSIFSAACEVPFVDITHNHKNKALLETINYEKASINFNEFNIAKMTKMLKAIIDDKNASEEIGSIVSMNKLLLNDLTKSILLT